MTKGTIIHLDNESKVLEDSANLFRQGPIAADFEYSTCTSVDAFKSAIDKADISLKCLIFDLAGQAPNARQLVQGDLEFLQYVKISFAERNIPIFIYSGYLDLIPEELKNSGTIFEVDKGTQSVGVIFAKIKLLHDSGFLDLFCMRGILENEIHEEMHQAFVTQFRSGEIERIIDAVQKADPANQRARCIDLFKRMAVNALMSKLLSPVLEGKSSVNAIEHFYRRVSSVEFWTGDILEKNDKSSKIIVLTPRCDCATAESFLTCDIESDFPKDTTKSKRDKIMQALTNNPALAGYRYRYLPPTPLFGGGRVNVSNHHIFSKADLKAEYHRAISLSDDLTNEILAKFGAFFLRTGINTISLDELVTYLDSLT
jgi:hypothetical protein